MAYRSMESMNETDELLLELPDEAERAMKEATERAKES